MYLLCSDINFPFHRFFAKKLSGHSGGGTARTFQVCSGGSKTPSQPMRLTVEESIAKKRSCSKYYSQKEAILITTRRRTSWHFFIFAFALLSINLALARLLKLS